MINFHLVQKRANRTAELYEKSHFLQQAMADRLMQRLEYIKLKPQRILDLGCATGWLSDQLIVRYPEAEIIGVDFALSRLAQAKPRPQQSLAGDMHALPLITDSIDFIVANDSLYWAAEQSMVLQEALRVLKPGGLLMMTSLGPLSMQRLRELCQQGSLPRKILPLLDMHDIGDMFLQAGWSDPVMDSEWLQLQFDSTVQMARDFHRLGVGAIDGGKGMITPRQWQTFWQQYPKTSDGKLVCEIELIHGHAWKPLQASGAKLNEQGEVVVPLSSLRKKQ